jgi:hypothetical protein
MFTLIVTITAGNPIVLGNDYTAELAEAQRDSFLASGKVIDAYIIPTGPEPYDA